MEALDENVVQMAAEMLRGAAFGARKDAAGDGVARPCSHPHGGEKENASS